MTHPYYDKRNATIYKMRVEEKKTLEEVGNQFDLCKESIRYIVAKQERANAEEEERRAAPPDTIGAMRISTRLKNFIANEDFYGFDTVIYFLQTVSMREMMRVPNFGKKTLKELIDEAEKIVGEDVMRRWIGGKL
jgi:DNA-directed RNA polymerase alpha subunit